MTLMEWDQREVLDKETPQSNENIAISSIHLCLSVYPLCKATRASALLLQYVAVYG